MNSRLGQDSRPRNGVLGTPKWQGSQGPGYIGVPSAAQDLPFYWSPSGSVLGTGLFPERAPSTRLLTEVCSALLLHSQTSFSRLLLPRGCFVLQAGWRIAQRGVGGVQAQEVESD